MKKYVLTAFILVLLAIFLFPASGYANDGIKVKVDGRDLVMDVAPVFIEGRTLVPFRSIFETLGASVEWDGQEQKVSGIRSSTSITLQLNNKQALVNGNVIELDAAATLIDGRTMVPIRFIAESLGAKVDWDQISNTVVIQDTFTEPAIMDYPSIDLSQNVLLKISADKNKGFNWDYYLFIPKSVVNNDNIHLLVEPNNTGTGSNDISIHDRSAKSLVERSHANELAKRLEVPLLVPVFPRPGESDWHIYTHALDRDSMLIKDGPLKRIDLQLIAMIKDAQELLASNGIETAEKVFMNGFSASGNFLTRFPMLHPHMVRAFAAGGVNSIPTFPTTQWNSKTLRYPVGIADIKEIAGIEFNLEEYRKVSQYIYMGYLDKNDTIPYRDAYDQQDADLIVSLIGQDMLKRWEVSQSIFKELDIPAQFVTYNGTAHLIREEMLDDIVSFFKANTGDKIVQISPHQYPYILFGVLEDISITGAYWAGDKNIPSFVHIPNDVFVVFIKEWIVHQDYQQLNAFLGNIPQNGKVFTLKANGYPDVQAKLTGHNFSSNPQSFVVGFTPQELDKMVAGIPYTIHPVKADNTFYFTANPGVTITKP